MPPWQSRPTTPARAPRPVTTRRTPAEKLAIATPRARTPRGTPAPTRLPRSASRAPPPAPRPTPAPVARGPRSATTPVPPCAGPSRRPRLATPALPAPRTWARAKAGRSRASALSAPARARWCRRRTTTASPRPTMTATARPATAARRGSRSAPTARAGEFVGGTGGAASTVHCPKGAFVNRVDSWFDDTDQHARPGVSIYCATPTLVQGASSYSVTLTPSTPAPYQKSAGPGATDERDDDCGATGLTAITYTTGLADNAIEGLGNHCGTSAVTLAAGRQHHCRRLHDVRKHRLQRLDELVRELLRLGLQLERSRRRFHAPHRRLARQHPAHLRRPPGDVQIVDRLGHRGPKLS